ncbi:MAG: CHASE2 domain-containing protein [Cyanobacteria bacterium P01_C01_bin.69]
MIKIILNLGSGSLTEGCQTIVGEVWSSQPNSNLPNSDLPNSNLPNSDIHGRTNSPPTCSVRFTGQLPAAPELAVSLEQWQQLYYANHKNIALRIKLLQEGGISYSDERFRKLCLTVSKQLNQWLDTPTFREVDRILRRELARSNKAQIILETRDTQLQKLPWHLWTIFAEYPSAALSFSTGNWQAISSQPITLEQANILVTLGHDHGLDLTADLKALNHLSDEASLTVLKTPRLNQLHEKLWQPQGWDIFFFAGHSKTQEAIGVIDLNEQESLTIDQLKHTLSKAIEQGLKIAIFNSCDGLGLVQQLSELQIPYIIVMREAVPDEVAHQFVHYLLYAFAAGAPFHLAFREARQRLAGLDNDIPGASWLPIIWQNPTASAIYWKDLPHAAQAPTVHKEAHKQIREQLPQFNNLGKNSLGSNSLGKSIGKGLVAGAFVFALRALGVLEPIELAAYDRLMRQQPLEPIDPRIVTVEISEEVTSAYGYPLPDEVLTTLIDKVNQSAPLAIGLDIHRASPRPAAKTTTLPSTVPTNASLASSETSSETSSDATKTGYARFLQQVEDNPNLFLVCSYSSSDENYQAPQQLPEQLLNEQVGFSDLPVDLAKGARRDVSLSASNAGLSGATVRRHLLSYDPTFSPTPSTCTTPYSLSFQLAYQYLYEQGTTPLTVTENEHWQFGEVVFNSLPQRFGGYQQIETPSSQILLNYRANRQPAQIISVEQLLDNNFDSQIMKDRIVLIGYTAPITKDYFETPYGIMPGIWIHAHMVSQLIGAVLDDRPLIQALPQWRNFQWGDLLWILAWGGLGGYVGTAFKQPLRWLLTIVAITLLLYGVCWGALVYGLWLPLVPSALATGGATVGAQFHRKTH